MFKHLVPLSGDPILRLIELYREDTRADKIDVGVGVFRNEQGQTPVMRAVREAEQRLHDSQTTKSYVGIAGDTDFNAAMIDLVFADSVDQARVCGVQAPGGSGALRITADMLYHGMDEKTVWVSNPTWGNHIPIFEAAGFTVNSYPYLDPMTKMVDEMQMLSGLAHFGPNDIVLLHGCCHNPSGSDLSLAAWEEIGRLANQNGFLPFIDLAYQGFGDGLDEDLAGVRKLASMVDNLVVTSSCSKNFGLYRDRVGCAMIMGKDAQTAQTAQSHLTSAGRVAYSMPPDHGAAIVATIMNDSGLRADWEKELTEMRGRILSLRQQLSATLAEKTDSNNWDFIARHRGMFSLLCLSQEQTDKLINEHSIYIVNGGRINIAGLQNEAQVNRFAQCLAEVTR